MKKISFSVDGQELVGTLFYPENIQHKNPAILFFHGWKSSEESAKGSAQALIKLGFICLTFNFRGNGISEGNIEKLTRSDFLHDALAAYDYIAVQDGVDRERINIVGASFGAYLATLVSKERKARNLVLRAPANYPNEGFDEPQVNFAVDKHLDILQWRFKTLKITQTYTLEALHIFKGKVLIVESEKDELAPHETIKNYIHAVKNKKQMTHIVMKGADHAIRDEKFRVQYNDILTQWFRNKY